MADANARIRRSPNGRESVVMYTNADWNHLREEHEIAYLRADICLGSPQSYSLEEKRQICEDMDANTKASDAACVQISAPCQLKQETVSSICLVLQIARQGSGGKICWAFIRAI